VMFAKIIPNWSKLLAVSAPWGIVFNEYIFGWVLNNFVEFSSYNNGDWSVILFWYWFRFKMWLNFTSKNIINELSNVFNGQISGGSWGLIFFHVSWEDSSKSRKGRSFNTHEFSKSLLDSTNCIRVSEEHFSFMCLSSLIESLHEGSIFIFFGTSE